MGARKGEMLVLTGGCQPCGTCCLFSLLMINDGSLKAFCLVFVFSEANIAEPPSAVYQSSTWTSARLLTLSHTTSGKCGPGERTVMWTEHWLNDQSQRVVTGGSQCGKHWCALSIRGFPPTSC